MEIAVLAIILSSSEIDLGLFRAFLASSEGKHPFHRIS